MIYVTGDCHGNFRRFQSEYFPEQANMTKDDTVIITATIPKKKLCRSFSVLPETSTMTKNSSA